MTRLTAGVVSYGWANCQAGWEERIQTLQSQLDHVRSSLPVGAAEVEALQSELAALRQQWAELRRRRHRWLF